VMVLKRFVLPVLGPALVNLAAVTAVAAIIVPQAVYPLRTALVLPVPITLIRPALPLQPALVVMLVNIVPLAAYVR
jgi:hypothetical protein